jgi:flagellar basal-body rod modification protein FlgD
MTTINPATIGTQSATSQQASTSLASNFETFLNLLTTQLQNQDPLSPMDTKDFTQQLVQFTGVEQQLRTNDLLETLTSLNQLSAGATAVAYLGKPATATTPLAKLETGGTASWDYQLPRDMREVRVRVVDSQGRTMANSTGNTTGGAHTFTWDGKNLAGQDAPTGVYRLIVEPIGADGRPGGVSLTQTGPVTDVDMSGTSPVVRINGVDLPLTAITRIGASS